jgi:plasmid stabilization system protein ParE
MKLKILEEAEQDLIDGFHFYEAQNFGLGQYFLDTLFSDINSLQLFAGIHPWYFSYQRLLSKRFPFAIYYRVDKDTVRIHAVLDCRQDPQKIQDRLT